MKKKKFILTLVISSILLMILNIGLLYRHSQNEKELSIQKEQLNKLTIDKKEISETFRKSTIYQQASEATTCKDFKVIDPINNEETILFKDIIHNKVAQLFFRFKETNCDACTQNTLKQLSKLSAQFPKQGIIVLAGYKNIRQFNAFAQTYKLNFKVFNVHTLPIVAEKQNQPYLFVVTSEYKIQNIFIVNKSESRFTAEYLRCMTNKYWNTYIRSQKKSKYSYIYE